MISIIGFKFGVLSAVCSVLSAERQVPGIIYLNVKS